MFFQFSDRHRKTPTRAFALTLLLALAWLPATSQALNIAQGWRFTTGDNAAWAQPEFDDSTWKPIEIGRPWEKAGHKDYDGYGWYRLRVNVPKAESESAYFKQYQRLTLLLGAVDDVDVTYFNGVEVGRTGSVPDDTKGHYKTNRCYDVPAKHIRWDAENVIAVRVFDSDGDGGMHKGIPTLLPPVWNDFVTVDIDHGHANGIYPSGAPMDLSVTIQNTAFETIKGTVRFQVGSDTWLADQRETFSDISKPVQLSAGKSHIETLTFEPPAAGFYQVTCTFTRDGDKTPISQSRMRGYAPEKMDRPTDAPKDLRAFWDKTIAELATVAPQYKVEPSPKWSTEQTDCYLVEMRSLGDVRIRGWFEVPKSPGPHPVLLRVPGYTQGMMPSKSIPDMAVFSLNIRGHGNSTDDEPAYQWWGPGDYLLRGLDDPQKFFYRGAIMDCLRGVDFVASRPEIDTKRIAITGGSQGGMLSFATAALDKRIALSAPDIPFIPDSMKAFKMTSWPGMVIRHWLGRDPKNTWELASATFSYVDPKNLAGWIDCPVFMGVGLQDNAAPAPAAFAAYNQLRSPKEYRVYPEAGHSTPPEHGVAKIAWIRERFAMAK
ncbi:MAG: acetylxylan esterase [Verrucomicrobiales bacterium]